MKRETKIQKSFTDKGFGFPVKLLNVPMVKIRGNWTPQINYNRLSEEILCALCHKPARLTGSEVRFIRQHLEMTLQTFAKRFSVSHPAVLKWERSKNTPTKMAWTTEKDIRLFLLSTLNTKPKEFMSAYQGLEKMKPRQKKTIELDAESFAA